VAISDRAFTLTLEVDLIVSVDDYDDIRYDYDVPCTSRILLFRVDGISFYLAANSRIHKNGLNMTFLILAHCCFLIIIILPPISHSSSHAFCLIPASLRLIGSFNYGLAKNSY
jgi:hypothetical protein